MIVREICRRRVPPVCVPAQEQSFLDDGVPGVSNNGVCEFGGLLPDLRGVQDEGAEGSFVRETRGHAGLTDNLMHMSPGDFILLSRRTYDVLLGFHETPQNDYMDLLHV